MTPVRPVVVALFIAATAYAGCLGQDDPAPPHGYRFGLGIDTSVPIETQPFVESAASLALWRDRITAWDDDQQCTDREFDRDYFERLLSESRLTDAISIVALDCDGSLERAKALAEAAIASGTINETAAKLEARARAAERNATAALNETAWGSDRLSVTMTGTLMMQLLKSSLDLQSAPAFMARHAAGERSQLAYAYAQYTGLEGAANRIIELLASWPQDDADCTYPTDELAEKTRALIASVEARLPAYQEQDLLPTGSVLAFDGRFVHYNTPFAAIAMEYGWWPLLLANHKYMTWTDHFMTAYQADVLPTQEEGLWIVQYERERFKSVTMMNIWSEWEERVESRNNWEGRPYTAIGTLALRDLDWSPWDRLDCPAPPH